MDGFAYIIAQLLGSVAGAGLAKATFTGGIEPAVTALSEGVSLGHAFLIEFIITSILLLVVIYWVAPWP